MGMVRSCIQPHQDRILVSSKKILRKEKKRQRREERERKAYRE
jgi:heme exporter protein D